MPEIHHHTESQAVAQALSAVLPVPSRTRVHVLTCGCPDADGRLFWSIDTETRRYELTLALDAAELRDVQLTSEPRFGEGTSWTTQFLVRDTSAPWAQALASLVARLAVSDHSPLALD